MDADVFTVNFCSVVLMRTTKATQVRVTFPYSQITRALLRITLSFASASREPILTCKMITLNWIYISIEFALTVCTAEAEFFTEILSLDTIAILIARKARVVTGCEIVNMI